MHSNSQQPHKRPAMLPLPPSLAHRTSSCTVHRPSDRAADTPEALQDRCPACAGASRPKHVANATTASGTYSPRSPTSACLPGRQCSTLALCRTRHTLFPHPRSLRQSSSTAAPNVSSPRLVEAYCTARSTAASARAMPELPSRVSPALGPGAGLRAGAPPGARPLLSRCSMSAAVTPSRP
jgi:hypothetical protein